MNRSTGIRSSAVAVAFAVSLLLMASVEAIAQGPAATSLQGYGLKIYNVESALYPFVQVYFRTFDQNQEPLINLNELNIGLLVKGRSYDPMKRQYGIESIRNRAEALRTTIILDASISMRGAPFEAALEAAVRFIDSKRPQDEISVLAIRDTKEGYEIVSPFERDAAALARRLADVRADGQKTRLYDAIAAAMQSAGMAAQGSATPGQGDYIVSRSIVVFSDGRDEGSAFSRQELNTRITNLEIPIPIYSVAYTKISTEYFKNLEALSKNSFGKYYTVGEAYSQMQRVVENIQHVLQNDYVVTFRAYQPVDGESHAFKLGVEYPSRSGRVTYESARFEAIEPPPFAPLLAMLAQLNAKIPPLPDGNPYISRSNVAAPPAQ